MTSVSQTVSNFYGGISQQPDYTKSPGQVNDIVNAIPDLTYGLFKRPGSKRISPTSGSNKDLPLPNVQSGGSWFHYYRDETEGSYVGQVDSTGTVRIWSCDDGDEMTVNYSTSLGGTETNLKSYLTTSDPEELHFLTINDTTFVNNSNANKTISVTGKTPDRPHTHAAFLELTKAENGRQYAINLHDSNQTGQTTYNTATRLEIQSTTIPANGTPGSGHCPATGTGVFDVTSGNKTNLIFRLTTRGQQVVSSSYSVADGAADTNDYGCTYTKEITLLHGGEGWTTGDTTVVTMEGFNYTIRVADHEQTKANANIKAVRPAPTPFDADTAVTTTQILAGISAELTGLTGIGHEIIGNGIYIYSDTKAFNLEVVDIDIMKAITKEANSVDEIPVQCKHGYIVKIANTDSEEDDFFLRFDATNGVSGLGNWVECAEPDIDLGFDLTNMPITIQRTAVDTFTVARFGYANRDVGDDNTNPFPKFINRSIERVLFFRNRLVFLAGENVIASRPGNFGDFFNTTALTVSTSDPIDIACSSTFPSTLMDGIEIPNGLLIFSTDQQFLLTTDDSVLTPETARLASVATYNYNQKISPISLGKTVGFLDNSGQYGRFFEIANVASNSQPDVVEQSKVIQRLLPSDIDNITNSRENGIVLINKSGTADIYGYKYYNTGDKRLQAAWFKWKLPRPIRYQFVVDDAYYFVSDDDYLQMINLVQETTDPSIDKGPDNYLLHVDNYTTISGGTYNPATNTTAFTASWLSVTSTQNGSLVLIDDSDAQPHTGRYAIPTVAGTTITADGDWSGRTLIVGYLYEMLVEFPTIFVTKSQGEITLSEVTSNLTVHRIKIGLGQIGQYQSKLKRLGKTDFTQTFESTIMDAYIASTAPLLTERIETIPVYEKNTNVDIFLLSNHPSPASVRSLSWEGDYTNKFYQRS